jgi:hypothetical protein
VRSVGRPAEPTLAIRGRRGGRQQLALAKIRNALPRNDAALIALLRDAVALLAAEPVQERVLLQRLVEAGIPEPILTGPIRPAVIDGSNIANMSPERRARLIYLEQIQRAAWDEGYFPVTLIVDASLPHQIDQPQELLARIERGEITMAPAGTSADELLIEEAQRQGAVLITNDRMTNWPAAKQLEKRHAEIRLGTVRVGGFHSSSWLSW